VLNNTAYTVANFRVRNHPPNTPSAPSPAHGAIEQSLDVDLSWTGGDPDGDPATYDVYFGAISSPTVKICDDASAPSCDPGTLNAATHYYWYVVATDSHSESTKGPVWDFSTVNTPPNTPSIPLPADGATGESVDVSLAWTGGDPDAGDTVTYTVYLDTGSSPSSQVCQGAATTCDPPGSLTPNTSYYWQVVAADGLSETTPGPVWNFTTGTSTGPTIRGYVRDASLAALEGVTVTFGNVPTITTTSGNGYHARAGLSGTYTVTVSADGYTFSPYKDLVTVGSEDVIHNVTGYTLTPASLLFYDGFESGILGSAWAIETDYEGRVRVSASYPYTPTGSYSLLLDDDTDGGFTSHASAILSLDLSGETQVKLGFRWREFTDENHADDGVFISGDGGDTWHQVYSFNGGQSTFAGAVVDLDAEAGVAGLTLDDHFLLKFQFYDDFSVEGAAGPRDGYAIDDVIVYSDKYNVYLPVILNGWP
jgi:hypothetical protein